MNRKNMNMKSCLSYAIPFLLVLMLFSFFTRINDEKEEIPIGDFITYMEEDRVEVVQTMGNKLKGKYAKDKIPKGEDNDVFSTYIPNEMMLNFYDNYLKEKVENGDIKYSSVEDPGPPW